MINKTLFLILAFAVVCIAAYLNNSETPEAYYPTQQEVAATVYPNILYKDSAEAQSDTTVKP